MGSPLGRAAAATTGAGITLNVKGVLLAVAFAESVTVKTRPVAVVAVAETGPEMVPVDVFSDRPSGRVPVVSAQVL